MPTFSIKIWFYQPENKIIKFKNMGIFERYLTIWVGLSIVVGVALGRIFPFFFEMLSNLQYANVNFIVAILIWGHFHQKLCLIPIYQSLNSAFLANVKLNN